MNIYKMGISRLCAFINKYVTNGIDDFQIDDNNRKFISHNVLFDINFIIYQSCINIENDINDILKIIYCKNHNNNDTTLDNYINRIFQKKYWNNFLIDYSNIDIFLTTVSNSLDAIIHTHIEELIKKSIEKIHYIDFIKTIVIFFDAMPSISKIIEQRRRRIKNHFENIERKKLHKIYISKLKLTSVKLYNTLHNKYIMKDDLNTSNYVFNYSKWIENRFIVDKAIYPMSPFILELEKYLSEHLFYNNVEIIINKSSENGESDMKIFQHIDRNSDKNESYSIHTTDSDLIHHALIQQIFYNLNNKDISINIYRYLKNYSNGHIQYLNSQCIVNNINNNYLTISNKSNILFIWDICFIFYLFGNDHLPTSMEIGTDLGLDFFIKEHYNSLSNNTIMIYSNDKLNINLDNLLIFFKHVNKRKKINITKLILLRYFKISFQFMTLLLDKFNFNFIEILLFLKNFIIYKALLLTDIQLTELWDCDMRKIFLSEDYIKESYIDLSIFNFSEENKEVFINNINIIEENISYYDYKYNGLILHNKSINITHDCYQDLYNFISEKATDLVSNKYPQLYENIDIDYYMDYLNNINIYDELKTRNYLKKLIHLTYTQFSSMKDFHSDNITYYKYLDCPTLDNVILFLSNTPNKQELLDQLLLEIDNENVDTYITPETHYTLITPHLNNNLFINKQNFNYRDIIFKY